MSTPNPWSEESKYLAYLERERRLFAWTLRQYGSFTEVAADDAALARYPYEAPGDYRGLIFHDEAWHYAMIRIHGEQYWIAHPGLQAPPPEYRDIFGT